MKVAYIIESAHNSGGMERVLTVSANALCYDVDISIITLYQNKRQYYFPLDNKIKRYDLDIENVADKKLLKQRMTEFLMSHHFDIVVSMGGIDMYCLHTIKDGSKKIVWFHFAHNVAYTAWLGDSPTLIKKLKGYLRQIKRIKHARGYERVVVISSADYQAWQRYTNKATLIYNPLTIKTSVLSDLSLKRVISVGRLDYQKGYDLLIDTWKIVSEKHSDWQLDIYGDGPLRDIIQKQIDDLCLSKNVTLCGQTANIAEKYAEHSIYVMASRTECFPLVLIEASDCGLPLVAYDCPFGPRDIIDNCKNGFLIPNVGDVAAMADKICQLIDDVELRKQMGEKAKLMVGRFSPSKIKNEWLTLFNDL